MRRRETLVLLAFTFTMNCTPAIAADATAPLPAWAYVVDPLPDPVVPPGGPLMHVPDSSAGYTLGQIANLFTVPDWHPAAHPPMPPVVACGRKPAVFACGYCHLPNGLGRPENASLAGLPVAYVKQQIAAFENGDRKAAASGRGPIVAMLQIAHALTPAEVQTAAGYFSALKRTLLRDDASGFVAYVPPGSIARGEVLAKTGGGKNTPCIACHGGDLRGLAEFPPLAGRSPSYLVRQMIDIQRGFRKGPAIVFMTPVVANLSQQDIIDVVAYSASLAP